MRLREIHLVNFRNFQRRSFYFDGGFNVITGPNGVGKTNLLEAIGYLATGKSIRKTGDNDLIHWGSKSFLVEGIIVEAGNMTRKIKLRFRDGEKEVFIDGKVSKSLRELYEVLPIVSGTIMDLPFVEGDPGARRRFLDKYLSLIDPEYHEALGRYRKALKHKNVLLKEGRFDTLPLWNRELERTGYYIVKKRRTLVNKLSQILLNGKAEIIPHKEIKIFYRPSLSMEYEVLDEFMNVEIKERTALYGPHRDKIQFLYRGSRLEHTASQGEKWLFYFTVLMSLRSVFNEVFGKLPLLLLDEPVAIFGEDFVKRFISGLEGQTIITSVHPLSFGYTIYLN